MPVQSPDGIRISNPMTSTATAPAVQRRALSLGGGAVLGLYIGRLPQTAIDAFAIEQIVGVERNDLPLRRHEMDAGALHRTDAEIVAVEELHDDDAEHLVVAEIGRHLHLRQAAEQITERGFCRLASG